MSLAGTVTYWDRARKKANSHETWLVHLYYDDETAGTDLIYLSDRDITVSSKFYHGIILDFGSISESVDLAAAKASIGNVDIVCNNKYGSGTFASELWPADASPKYINRKVEIYSRFGDTTDIADCRLIYEGRLFNIKQTDSSVTLNIEQKQPQDYIQIPNAKTSNGIYAPVIYGNYSAASTDDLYSDVHPVPVTAYVGNKLAALNHQTDASDAALKHYHKDLNEFHPFDPEDTGTQAYETTFHISLAPESLNRGFVTTPQNISGDDEFTSTANAIDDNTGTNATSVNGPTTSNETIHEYLILDMPNLGEGVLTTFELHVENQSDLEWDDADSGALTAYLGHQLYGSTSPTNVRTHSVSPLPITPLIQTNSKTTTVINLLSLYTSNNNTVPPEIKISHTLFSTGLGGGAAVTTTMRIYRVWLNIQIALDFANEPTASSKTAGEIVMLYNGTDGFTESYTDGSGVAATCHEIFRDMIYRYAGFDLANADLVGISVTDFNTARSGWTAKFWATEPEPLQDILDQLQFEGGFIFKYHPPDGGKIIWVKNSYASSDIVHTITKKDRSLLQTRLTDFSEIITQVNYNYGRHPAENKYMEARNYTNTTSRSNYWPGTIAPEENIAKVDLDYLIDDPKAAGDSDPNDCIALYYDNIWADPKIIVSCDIVNPDMYDLEIGDIVAFNESFISYGKSNTTYFMVVSVRRSVGQLSIQCREVYNA